MNSDTTTYPMPRAQFRAYVKIFCFLSAAILISILSLNYLVDPYLIHQWNSPLVQRLRPPVEKLSPWGKTYAVAKYKPSVVYLGNSRTELGLPTSLSIFSGKRVFNNAISGATIGDAIAMAEHAATVNRLDTVVWGIDYASFSLAVGSTDLDRELVADTGNYYFFRRALMDVKRSLAGDMTKDSLKLLLGYFGSVCRSSLAFHGQRDDACMVTILQDRGGTAKASEAEIKSFSQSTPSAEAAMMTFDLALKEMCDAGTEIRLYINPTHASMSDAIFWTGNWNVMEAWQRSLVRIVDLNRQSGCDIRLFDFSGFNSITTEAIPQVSGQKEMKNYWEASHYRSHIGAMVLKRMFVTNNDSVPGDFGIELNSEMLPAYLEKIRHDRDQYHINHPVATQLVKQLVSNMHSADGQ